MICASTQVIVKESDRLQTLVDRLLEPHRHRTLSATSPFTRSASTYARLIVAEFPPAGLTIERDYDVKMPDLRGDKEQLIQALLNIVRNAAQALRERISEGDARMSPTHASHARSPLRRGYMQAGIGLACHRQRSGDSRRDS